MQGADYRRIPLWRRDGRVNRYALVDANDYKALSAYRWWDAKGYGRRNEGTNAIIMHRVILGLERGDPRHTDHINRNRADNRRANLRIVTPSQNAQNRIAHRSAVSRFRGVWWDRQGWRVRPRFNGRQHHVGRFATEIEAAMAAEIWRREHMPFAQPDPELVRVLDLVRAF